MKEVKERNQQLCKILAQGECELIQTLSTITVTTTAAVVVVVVPIALHSFVKDTASGAN